MPITECTFYFSNILFGWISTTLFLVGYYACFVGLIFLLDKQVDLIHFQEYWKHLLVGSYFFLSASIYLQLVYLLTSLISAKVPHRYQKISKYLLFLIVLVAEVGLNEQLLDGYRKIAFLKVIGLKFQLDIFLFIWVILCLIYFYLYYVVLAAFWFWRNTLKQKEGKVLESKRVLEVEAISKRIGKNHH